MIVVSNRIATASMESRISSSSKRRCGIRHSNRFSESSSRYSALEAADCW